MNLGQNEGKCLASSAPSPSCGLGYVKYSYADGESSQAALYLVTPPTVGDIAGIALDNGKTTETAPVTLLTSPADQLKVEFPPFPTQNEEKIDNQGTVEAEIQLSSPRMPTACGAPLFFDLSASTFDNTTSSTSAPLSVSCSSAALRAENRRDRHPRAARRRRLRCRDHAHAAEPVRRIGDERL